MQQEILILKGLPGSGKSTFAQELVSGNPGWRRVNKDDLRKMFGGYKPKHEKEILNWRDTIIEGSLNDGWNVVVDDTNFHPKHEACIRAIAAKYKAKVEVHFIDTPLDECIRRDARREEPVGEKVIKKMWRDYVRKPFVPKEKTPGLPLAIICDLDGTLCLFESQRSPYDTAKAGEDRINLAVEVLLNYWSGTKDWPIIFMTGRDAKYRDITQAWLDKHGFGNHLLLMRPAGDTRKDYIVKEELYQAMIERNYNIYFVLDDRQQVVDMWRRNGLTCFQVAEGDF